MAERATALGEWKRHWPLALVSALGMSFSPVGTFSLGLFMEPLQKEFGWGRADVSSGMFPLAVLAFFLSSPVGALIDRLGARKVGIPGMVLGIVGLGSLSLANGSLTQWLGLWILYGTAVLFIKTTLWTAGVSRAFTASRGLALGVVLCGIGIAQTLTPIIAQQLIDNLGWRQAYLLLAGGWGGLVLVLVLLFFHDVRAAPPVAGEPAVQADLPGYTFTEAMRTRQVWQIIGAIGLNSLIGVGVSIHLVPILGETGLDRTAAAALAGLAGSIMIAGKLLTGTLIDRFGGALIPFAAFAMPAVGMALLLFAGGSWTTATLAVCVMGYAAGATTQSSAYLVSRYAGLKSYGAVYGILSSLIGLSMGVGPWIAGRVFDVSGSYQLVLTIGAPLAVLSGLLLAVLGPYPDFTLRKEGSVPHPA